MTKMATTKVVTKPQLAVLQRMMTAPAGRTEWMGTRGIEWSNWRRMMERLCMAGYARPYVHGGYEITEAGQNVVRAQQVS